MTVLTFEVAVGTDDGFARGFDTAWPPLASSPDVTGAGIYAWKGFGTPTYYCYNACARWDTSSIPDGSTIDAAVFRVFVTAKNDADNRSVCIEWYDAGVITSADYTATEVNDAHAGTDITAVTNVADNDFALTNLGSINLSGYTGIRMHVTGGIPTGDNSLEMSAFESVAHPGPRLEVTFTEPPVDIAWIRA